MHISAIRTYIVELQAGDNFDDRFQGKAGMVDLFPGEKIHKITQTKAIPRIYRVETTLSIQGQSKPWAEPVEKGKVGGSMDFTGEDPEKEGIASSSSSPSGGSVKPGSSTAKKDNE